MTTSAGNTVTTTPTVANATSVTLLAANKFRKFLRIQNASAANIAINLEGATLTGIVPTTTNKCIVLPSTAGSNVFTSNDGFVPCGAVTVYQTSGAGINTIVVVEG